MLRVRGRLPGRPATRARAGRIARHQWVVAAVWSLLPVLLAARPAAAQEPRHRDVSRERARAVPEWVRDAVVYEVFPRAFSATGDLAGVTARLDELRELGVSVVWLMPIHPIGEERRKGTLGSPYAVRDYEAIHPDYGTPDDLRALVRAAHARGMRVILDVVANHTAWDSALLRRHPEYFRRDASGRIAPPLPDWADVADLDYGQPGLRAYMIGMLARWVREFDVDGFRCDVAGMVPTEFWEEARPALERVKPGLLLLAEASEPELLLTAFDLDYAWPLHSALTDVLQGRAPASRLREVWQREEARFPRGARHLLFSDNHDERRALARFGEEAALAASALVFTLPGVPLLYNGQEVGDTTESGAPALFERLPVFWPIAERRPHFRPYYRALARLRLEHPALRFGGLDWRRSSDEPRALAYARSDGREELLVVANLSSRPLAASVEAETDVAWREVGPPTRPPAGGPTVGRTEAGPVTLPTVFLDAWQVRVFVRSLAARE